MCVTHIYTDCYPKRTVEFHQTIVCPNAKDGVSCPAHITNEHPPRTLQSNDARSSKEYIDQGLKVPASSKTSPLGSTTTTTYRYSQGDKKDKSPGREPRLRLVRKRSALVTALTPRRKHPKERIVIVDAPDSPEGSRGLQQYAPNSPATEEFHSNNLLIDDRLHRQESSSPRRSPSRSLNPVRTVVVEQHHHERREHSKERERPLQQLPIILAPEPPSRSPSREKGLVDMRIRREEEEREKDRQREYEREQEKSFELVHEARREQERKKEELRKVAEEVERERIKKEKSEDDRRRDAEYKKFIGDRDRERELEREKDVEEKRVRDREEEILRERERARSSEQKREDEVARERERRKREEETRRADDHEVKRRDEKHRREKEREREIEAKEREERMRKAERSERKAADDARKLAEQVKSFAREDEEIRRRAPVVSRERDNNIEERWKKGDEDMYARLRERQVRDEGHVGLGRGASFLGRGEGDRDVGVLDRLKERQKGLEEGFAPKRRTTVGGGGGSGERRRGEERIVWDEGVGGRGGRW
ncbi:hypothetical protein SBOR_2427 [Sclerotinia borealis F-4128]|uniref:Uncharacterized protein n=1 Tax=Sclerotinia borealis (strain F-4128) TaxID=1432307 RepID=W9CMT8_SCLBF|nr:hypothetical protein SBOR_2427 [Sclerotinia borealis F-4128]